MLSNILGNAIKFVSSPTTKEKTILLEAYKSDRTLSIILEDSGPGFGESDPNTLFEKYTIGEIHGTGLGMGLYLCKKIVEMHNGKITASHSKRL